MRTPKPIPIRAQDLNSPKGPPRSTTEFYPLALRGAELPDSSLNPVTVPLPTWTPKVCGLGFRV